MDWKTFIELVYGLAEEQIDSERNPEKYDNGTVLEFIFSVGFIILGFFLFNEYDGFIMHVVGIISLLIGLIGIITAIGIKGLLMAVIGIALLIIIIANIKIAILVCMLIVFILVMAFFYSSILNDMLAITGKHMSLTAKIVVFIILILILLYIIIKWRKC